MSNAWGPEAGEPNWDFNSGPDFTQQPGAYPYTETPGSPQKDPEPPEPPKDPIVDWFKRAVKVAFLAGVLIFFVLCIVAILLGFLSGILGAAL